MDAADRPDLADPDRVGPLLAWRRSTVSNLRYQFAWPVVLGAATMAGLYAAGFRVWVSACASGCARSSPAPSVREFVRGGFVRREATGTDLFTALVGLVARSRRRYGGYIVHIGIVLMFLGFAGSGYKLDAQLLLRPGQETEIGRYTVRYDRLTETSDARKQMITASMTVMVDGETVTQLYPAKWFFYKHESEPTTEVGMRHTVAEDLYIVLAGYEMSDQAASFQITVNPLVNWIWFGFTVLALGTGIALLPESAFAYAGATAPRGAATASTLLLATALSVMGPGAALAQPLVGAVQEADEASPLEIDLRRSLVCMCGSQGCGKKLVAECMCSEAIRMRAEIKDLVGEGMTRDEVLRFTSTGMAARSHWRRRSTRGSIGWPGSSRICWPRPAQWRWGVHSSAGRGLVGTRRVRPAQLMLIRSSRPVWMMNSGT